MSDDPTDLSAPTEPIDSNAAAIALLRGAPVEPSDRSRFSSGVLFGQPGIYPGGPPMEPAGGEPPDEQEAAGLLRDLLDGRVAERALERFRQREVTARVPEPGLRAGLLALAGGPAEPVLDAFLDGSAPVRSLAFGTPIGEGRVVGVEADDDDPARRVVNVRYRAEHPGVIAPSLAHAICHHGACATNAEEATLHGLLAAAHTWLLAARPELADLGTELSRRQASLTITLLNARSPGSDRSSIRCPDGPGAIPGGDPALDGPDLWSIPFTGRPPAECDPFVPAPVRASLARLATGTAAAVPHVYDESLGTWLTEHLGRGAWFGPLVRARAAAALGLFGAGISPRT